MYAWGEKQIEVLQKVVQTMDHHENHYILFQVTCKLLQSIYKIKQINFVHSLHNVQCTVQKWLLLFFPGSTQQQVLPAAFWGKGIGQNHPEPLLYSCNRFQLCSHFLFLVHAADLLLVNRGYCTFHGPRDTSSQLRLLPVSRVVTPLSLWAIEVRELVVSHTNSVSSSTGITSLTGLQVNIKHLIMQDWNGATRLQ